MLDDYEEATGDCGINDSTKKTIMMQLLPASLRVATRDTLMAARQTFVGVSAEYLGTIIVQRCEFDEAAMGSAIPMDAGGVGTQGASDEAASLGQLGVGLGLGKGGGAGLGKGGAYRAPTAPTAASFPQEAQEVGRSMINGQIMGSRLTPAEGVGQRTITGMIAPRTQTEANC